MEISNIARRSVPTEGTAGTQSPKRSGRRAAGIVIGALVLLAAFVVAAPYLSAALKQGSSVISGSTTTSPSTQTAGSSTATSTSQECSSIASVHNLVAPDISGGSANVAFPSDYCTLASYALGLINHDRTTNGLAAVALDYNLAAQQHADSMLYYGYFSHWDTQGYKPYMRFSLLGGTGGDAENVAYRYNSGSPYTSTAAVEGAINQSEYDMMYNDVQCCNNGHRDNILNPLHNFVSIGVAYNGTYVYFDEEFENNYMSLTLSTTPASSSNPYYVTMLGTPHGGPTPNAILVTYDAPPAPETPYALKTGPTEYGLGTGIGGVQPGSFGGCPQFSTGVTVCADKWAYSSSQIDIEFSLKDFINAEQQQNGSGPGVYNIFLVTCDTNGCSTNTAMTSISIFVT